MARYRVTEQLYVTASGHQYEPGESVTLPDDHKPPAHWAPLDEAARAALLKVGAKKWAKVDLADEVRPPEPEQAKPSLPAKPQATKGTKSVL